MTKNEIQSINEVKNKYFFVEDFDEVEYCINHNRVLLRSIIDAYSTIDKKYLNNLLETAKHYSEYRFINNIQPEHRLDKEWNEIIQKITFETKQCSLWQI